MSLALVVGALQGYGMCWYEVAGRTIDMAEQQSSEPQLSRSA
jgi:hypothetical protein